MNKAIASSCTSLTENDNSPAKVITRWNMFETRNAIHRKIRETHLLKSDFGFGHFWVR
jgi:hypothetical protein